MNQYESVKRTSLRQGRSREGRSGGSQRQNHGAMNKNAIEGPVSGVSQHNMTKPIDSGHTVNGALAGWKLMLLSGETSPTCVRDPGARRRVIVGVMGEGSAEDIVVSRNELGRRFLRSNVSRGYEFNFVVWAAFWCSLMGKTGP
jgi:hypothetical protein